MENSFIFSKESTLSGDVSKERITLEVETSLGLELKNVVIRDVDFALVFESGLIDSQVETLGSVVGTHSHLSPKESVELYLNRQVKPFIDSLITGFLAENITLGITQANKSNEVLGLFEERVNLGDNTSVSLKSCFDTSSLYTALDVLNVHLENIDQYSSLSPFVTYERLDEMKNKIIFFLGMG